MNRISLYNKTGRVPRSCQEAFGPYTSFDLTAPPRRRSVVPWITWAIIVVLLIIVLTLAA